MGFFIFVRDDIIRGVKKNEVGMQAGKKRARGRKLGQHFLFDRNILERIADAAELEPDDCVLEVGPGLGTLTECLAARAGKVVAVELDAGLMPALEERMAAFPNVKLVNADILMTDLNGIWKLEFGRNPFKVVANLPYYITAPVIMLFLESNLPVTSLTFMVQKEVAERLAAPPGSKAYGAISVAVQYRAETRRVFDVPAGAFSPPPRVQSAVIHMAARSEPPVAVSDEALFRKAVRGCFAMRRKTLRNNVSAAFGMGGEEAGKLLEAAGLDPSGRAERLGLPEFARLANALGQAGFKGK
jgi:16S rRNA (adenine1518-N6/adenine1519-N6)-dimethyltransferase